MFNNIFQSNQWILVKFLSCTNVTRVVKSRSKEETCLSVPLESRYQKGPVIFCINNSYIPGLKGIAAAKPNTDKNLAPFASQNYPPINQKPSKSMYATDESWGPISTDHENWSPGSFSIQSSGFYWSGINKKQESILEVSGMFWFYVISLLTLYSFVLFSVF